MKFWIASLALALSPPFFNSFLSVFLSQGKMTDTPASNSSASGAEFDMMAALDWKDGIATLPGSNIRVHILSDTA